MTIALHPKLIEAAAVEFAAADKPLTTKRVTLHLTAVMRRFVDVTPGLAEADVMVHAASYTGYEVPTSWMPRIAKAVGAVEMAALVYTKGRRKERAWALPAKAEEWAAAKAAHDAERERAAERVTVGFVAWDHLVASDELVVEVTVDGVTVATFRPGGPLGADLASEQAEELARKLRNRLVADAAAAGQVAAS